MRFGVRFGVRVGVFVALEGFRDPLVGWGLDIEDKRGRPRFLGVTGVTGWTTALFRPA